MTQSKQYDVSSKYIQERVKEIIIQLRKFRLEQGLTQKEVATLIGVRKGTICDMENFKYLPRLDLVIKYAEALGGELKLKV